MEEHRPALTVLLVSYNTRHLLNPCLDALALALRQAGPAKVIVVDNASSDGSAEHLEQHHPQVQLIRSRANVGFGRANNLALPFIDTPFLLLLNTDAFVAPESLSRTLAYMASHPKCGILGVRLEGRDKVLQPSCRYFPTPLNTFLTRTGFARWAPGVRLVDDMAWDHGSPRACDWVPGCFYLVRKEVVDAVGLFDPRYFLYFEEVDHCFATKQAGWEVNYFPDTTVVHLGGESALSLGQINQSGRQIETLQIESALIYFRKNHGLGGLLAHLILDIFADAMFAVSAVVRKGNKNLSGYYIRRITTSLKLLLRTSIGKKSTK